MPVLILWLVGEFFAIVLGICGVLKSQFRKHDSLRLGTFPFLFSLVYVALFLHGDWLWSTSILCWLSAVPGVLGLVTILRPVSKSSAAEPSASPNDGPATQPGSSGATEGPPSVS
jgi:hypothetical protein